MLLLKHLPSGGCGLMGHWVISCSLPPSLPCVFLVCPTERSNSWVCSQFKGLFLERTERNTSWKYFPLMTFTTSCRLERSQDWGILDLFDWHACSSLGICCISEGTHWDCQLVDSIINGVTTDITKHSCFRCSLHLMLIHFVLWELLGILIFSS